MSSAIASFILAALLGNMTGVLSAQSGGAGLTIGSSASEKATSSPRPSPPGEERETASEPGSCPADYHPSGDYYDWRKSGQPERPWFHKYDQSLVMKIFLAERTETGCSRCEYDKKRVEGWELRVEGMDRTPLARYSRLT